MTDDKKLIKKVIDQGKTNEGTGLPEQPGLELWWFPDEPEEPEKPEYEDCLSQLEQQSQTQTQVASKIPRRPYVPTSMSNSENRDKEDFQTHSSRYFEDTKGMSKESLQTLKSAFDNNILNVQVSISGKTYFNPDGLTYLADLVNLIYNLKPTPEKLDYNGIKEKVATPEDYFYDSLRFLHTLLPSFTENITRPQLFSPITVGVLCGTLTKIIPKVYTSEQLKSLNLEQNTKNNLEVELFSNGIVSTNVKDFVTRSELSKLYSYLKRMDLNE